MNRKSICILSALFLIPLLCLMFVQADEPETLPGAIIDGTEPGWVALGEDDFTNVNCYEDTWRWEDGILYCTGQPIGVMRTKETYTNFELVVEWRMMEPGGNSGMFVWVPLEALTVLEPGQLPRYGIEVQMLDHDYTRQFEESTGRTGNWFSTHGDIFPVGNSKLDPFPPLSPDGSRSFPRLELSKGVGEWNHYYVRCINGEVRLWVNGTEVSGGNNADPATGHICMESEGAPIEFRNLRIRELP